MPAATRKAAPLVANRPARRRRSRREADIIGLTLMAVAVLCAISLAKPALGGAAGEAIVTGLRYLFGAGAWFFALLLAYLGVLHVLDREHKPPLDLVIGGAILYLLVLWLVHVLKVGMTVEPGTPALFTHGGGLIGGYITAGMARLTGMGGSWVVMVALAILAVLLIVDMPLHRIVRGAARRARRSADAVTKGVVRASSVARAASTRAQPPFIEEPFRALSEPEEPEPPQRGYVTPRAVTLRIRKPAANADADDSADRLKPAVRVHDLSAEKGQGPASSGVFVLPTLDLLNPPAPPQARNEAEAQETIKTLETTLAQFNIEAKVVEISRGPTVTRFEIQLAPGIKVSKIVSLADNLAMALAAIDVRVEAPIPGKCAIGIEVPSRRPAIVSLRECMETREFFESPSKLTFVLGVDVAGRPRYADLAKMPHLLVGGSTNSGKSVCLNVLITSLLYRATPEELKFIFIDPKRVELSLYANIPHLLHPVVQDVKQAAGILRWAIKEMEHRYDLFVKASCRNITGYNEKLPEGEKPLPFIVIIVDELADLMMQQGAEVEAHVCRLAQLSRATGIHLVIATQRPSVDVITGTIKANIGSRIAFAVASHVDSRTILNMNGAERLIGRGDLLYMPIDAPKPTRMQGPFISEKEIDRVVSHLRAQGPPEYTAQVMSVDAAAMASSEGGSDDELFEQAVRLVVNTGHASTSMIQRKFKVGYTRAARLVDIMEEQGIVGSLDGAKPREILINKGDLDILFGGVSAMPDWDPDGPFTE
ncbi:MAG TPA: DNA translocase FtsK 4TM domain-containing protein [Armatimonadota bacterium]|jgi:S-DNA-T family DNA segregation ATPase FtsK/SpoIIIE